MTDNEIIKALECCIIHKCEKCPAKAMFCSESVPMAFAIPLINRQKAEIDELQHKITSCNSEIEKLNQINFDLCNAGGQLLHKTETIKAEAIKEFTERLKTEYAKGMNWFKKKESYYVDVGDIDNLVKEMVGDID